MEFSAQQKRVIDSRGKNLLVSAAAGSGKTTVLVERVLGLIKEGANIDDILIVTFTRAASDDMKQKLYRRMSEEAEKGSERFFEQLERLEFSPISTLHSFCTKVIRSNFELAGQDPNFRILSDAENRLLVDRELSELMEEAYGERREGFERLAFGRSDQKLKSMVLELSEFLLTRPDAEKWYDGVRDMYLGDAEKWISALTKSANRLINEALALGLRALQICRMPSGPMELENALMAETEFMDSLKGLSYEDLRLKIGEFPQVKAGRKSKTGDIELHESAKKLRERMKKLVREDAYKLVSLPLSLAVSDINEDAIALEELFRLAFELNGRLNEVRREKAALTFNDLERLTIELIKDEGVRKKLREKYKYVFVDEYQDTSDIQETIVSAVAGENNRFMVGDVKQSIYRFRNAVPELFIQKQMKYARGGENETIALSQNYRSRGAVIDFVNLIFERVMRGGDSEILYDADARLYKGGSFEGEDSPVEIMIIDKSESVSEEDSPDADSENEDGDDEDELKDAQREALLIASKIHEIKSADESLKYRDFCVITRVKKNVLSQMAEILALSGIPAYADETESAFDAIEVSVTLNALKILISRRREVELLSVLRSPMFLFTSNELAKVRIALPDGLIFDALESVKDDMPKAEGFLKMYDSWRKLMRSMPLSALIRRILDDTGYYAFMGALPGGRHRQANLDMLCELALTYEHTEGRSLSGFLEHMAQMKSIGDGQGAHELGESDDVVRLMTAHKSKGLEFKVVFASMLARSFKHKGKDGEILTDKDLGVAFSHIDQKLVSERPTAALKALKVSSQIKDAAEELRVLYVTLTRAKERLILTGTVGNLSQSLINWQLMDERPDMCASALDAAMSSVLSCPGCEALGGETNDTLPRVKLNVYSASEVKGIDKKDAEGALKNIDEMLNSDLWDEETYGYLTWEYPGSARPYAPVKATVTGLQSEITALSAEVKAKTAPAFISGEDASVYTQRGTAVHAALQALSYEGFRGIDNYFAACEEAARQLNLMADAGILKKGERALVRPAQIAEFMLSETGRRVLKADTVQREWRFTLYLPVKDVIKNYEYDDKMLVQGSIDLCFLEDDEWVLTDYKTDKGADDQELLNRYSEQVKTYAKALESLTGKRVKQALIYITKESRAIEVVR